MHWGAVTEASDRATKGRTRGGRALHHESRAVEGMTLHFCAPNKTWTLSYTHAPPTLSSGEPTKTPSYPLPYLFLALFSEANVLRRKITDPSRIAGILVVPTGLRDIFSSSGKKGRFSCVSQNTSVLVLRSRAANKAKERLVDGSPADGIHVTRHQWLLFVHVVSLRPLSGMRLFTGHTRSKLKLQTNWEIPKILRLNEVQLTFAGRKRSKLNNAPWF